MNTVELDRILAQSLSDRALQTAEKRALTEWAGLQADDESERALARSRAFLAARSTLATDPPGTMAWLEEVVKILAKPAQAAKAPERSKAYFSPGSACIQEVLTQFNEARVSCDVCVFTITDDRITQAIIRANARGLRVRVISDDAKSHDLGSDIEELHAAGVDCKMDVGQLAHMHHKFALFDGRRLMNGSFNWTRSASEQNEENLIVTADPILVAAFSERFESLWARLRG